MAKKVAFVLDIDAAGLAILQRMVKPTIRRSGVAILARASSMASSMSSDDPPTFTIEDRVGVIKQGTRAFTTVTAPYTNSREKYIAHVALAKARDAGRIN